jgi:hypothetical protein
MGVTLTSTPEMNRTKEERKLQWKRTKEEERTEQKKKKCLRFGN